MRFGDWPYPGKLSYVFTRQRLESSNVEIEFVSDDIPEFIRGLERRNIKKLWLVGVSELIEAFYTQGRIDDFIVTVFPNEVGKGIPLSALRGGLEQNEIAKLQSADYGSGVFQNHYRSLARF